MWRTALVARVIEASRYALIVLAAIAGGLAITNLVELAVDSEVPPPSDASLPAGDIAQPPAAERPASRRSEEAAILRRNLFGVEAEEGEEQVAARGPVRIDFVLRGTADVDGVGFAIIEDPEAGVQEVFAVGDRVFDVAKLTSVAPTSAVLAVKGRRYTLEMDVEEEAPPEDTGAAASRQAGERVSAAPPAAAAAENGIRPAGDNSYLVDRREVDHTIENLSYVITQARAVPVLQDGESIGFKVFNIRAGSLFERIGLRDGDIVQEVNGVTLDDPSKAVGLLDEIQASDQITLNFLRGTKPHTFVYKIR